MRRRIGAYVVCVESRESERRALKHTELSNIEINTGKIRSGLEHV